MSLREGYASGKRRRQVHGQHVARGVRVEDATSRREDQGSPGHLRIRGARGRLRQRLREGARPNCTGYLASATRKIEVKISYWGETMMVKIRLPTKLFCFPPYKHSRAMRKK